jgi:hypothetical protein
MLAELDGLITITAITRDGAAGHVEAAPLPGYPADKPWSAHYPDSNG